MVTLRLFGPPVVRDGAGREIRLRSRKQLGVLVYLLVERERSVPRGELMEAFWGDVPRERAYQSLCQAIVEIRRQLGRDVVVSRAETVRIGVATSTDVEALADDLERRDLLHPLQEMDWWGTAALAHWLERSRSWCLRMAQAVLLRGISANRLAGATLRVHRCAELLYTVDPLSEAAVLALAERELLQGDVVAAIRLLRAHRVRIAETLGCQPQPAVDRLLRRLEAGAHPPVERVPPRLAAHASRVRPTIFVARERELAQLEGAWQRVQAERVLHTCVVTGAGGIGKSSLVRRFAATIAARAQPVFVVSCQEIGAGIPFAATADLVEELLRDPAVSATDPVWLAEVSRIHPAVRQRYPGVPEALDVPPETIRLRIAEGLMRMIESVADGGPVAIVFDDMPYMDPATRDVIAVLLRRAKALPLLLITTRRLDVPNGRHPTFLLGQEVQSDHDAHVHMDALGSDQTWLLLAALAPRLQLAAQHVGTRIVDMSEGNPHFVEFLLSDWQRHESGSLAAGRVAHELPENWAPPRSLRDAFAQSSQDLPVPARLTMQLLAVAQRSLTPDEVARTLDLRVADLDQGVLELLDRRLLRIDSGQLAFRSEMHRALAYFAMTPESRRYHHAILARSIDSSEVPLHFMQELEAGRHFLFAGHIPDATRLIRRGAQNAIQAGAPTEAERSLALIAQATSGEVRAQNLLLLAEAQAASGEPTQCRRTLSIVDQTALGDRGVLECRLLSLRTSARLRDTSADEAMTEAATLIESALRIKHEAVALAGIQLLAEFAADAGDAAYLALAGEACDRLLSVESAQHAAAAAVARGLMALAQGDFVRAESVFRSGSSLSGLDDRHMPTLWRLLSGLSLAQTGLGNFDAAEQTLLRLEQLARSAKSQPSPLLWSNIAVLFQEQGRFLRAGEYFERAISSLPDFPSPRDHSIVYSSAASLALDLWDLGVADECLRRAEAAASASQVRRDRLDVLLVRADFHLALEENEIAWQVMRESVQPLGDRSYAMGESARQERLLRHLTLEAEGPAAFLSLRETRAQVASRLPLHGRIEVGCFEEWVGRRIGDRALGSRALDRAISGGFAGSILHLARLGCLPVAPDLRRAEATVPQLVDRFPSVFPEGIPEETGWSLASS